MIDDFITMGGTPAHSSEEVARQCDVVITCLPEDSALLEAVSGEHGLIHGVHPRLTVVDIGMLSIQTKEQARHALEQVGAHMLDCPISGIPPQVLSRKTVVFASGEKPLFERCKPVFEGFTNTIFYIGDFGAGTKMKCVANLLVGIHVLAAAEAMVLSTKAGLDPATVIQVISPSVASSAQFVARAQMMVSHSYEPALSTIHQLEECIVVINELAGVALGVGRRALDAIIDLAQTKRRGYGKQMPLAERAVFQRTIGESDLRLRAARGLIIEIFEKAWETVCAGRTPEPQLQVEMRSATTLVTEVALEVTTQAFRYGGGTAIHLNHILQRCLRDLQVEAAHLLVSDSAYELHGQCLLGMPGVNPMG